MTVVRKESAYEQSLDWMRAQISDGAWTVGNRVPTEPELMSVLGVGRNTVREAIKTLTSTGVLEIRRGSGTFVRARTDIGGLLGKHASVDEMKYVFEVRRALEMGSGPVGVLSVVATTTFGYFVSWPPSVTCRPRTSSTSILRFTLPSSMPLTIQF